jgi:hypothetical protein
MAGDTDVASGEMADPGSGVVPDGLKLRTAMAKTTDYF